MKINDFEKQAVHEIKSQKLFKETQEYYRSMGWNFFPHPEQRDVYVAEGPKGIKEYFRIMYINSK